MPVLYDAEGRVALAAVAAIASLLALRALLWFCKGGALSAPGGGQPGGRRRYLVLGAVAAVLFVALAVATVGGAMRGVDALAAAWLATVRGSVSIAFWQFVTDMGSSGAVAIGAVTSGVLLWSAGRRRDLRPLGLALLGALATTWATKYAIALPRPVFVTTTTAVSPTFPSAHASGAVALYGTLAWLVAARLSRPRAAFEVRYWAIVLIAGVGFSRVFLGVHNASDVAAGYLVGVAWMLLALVIAPPSERPAA
jgi:undecaprenyl-diphosphatase